MDPGQRLELPTDLIDYKILYFSIQEKSMTVSLSKRFMSTRSQSGNAIAQTA
jgi:hypothetical protein